MTGNNETKQSQTQKSEVIVVDGNPKKKRVVVVSVDRKEEDGGPVAKTKLDNSIK